MFGRNRKAASEAEQGADRRQVQRSGAPRAFSYYANRSPAPTPESRSANRRGETEANKAGQEGVGVSPPPSRSLFAGISFWLLLALLIVCAVKVLSLSSNPKIVVVDKNSVAASYLQPNAVYAAAAQKLLAGSVVNRCKLTVDAAAVSQKLRQQFPELLAVSMSIPLASNRPVVYVQPATPTLVLRSGTTNYALNGSGVVLSALSLLPSSVPQVVDQSGLTPRPGRQVLPSGTIVFVQTVAYQFKAAHLTISTFVLPANSPYELDVRLEGQPYSLRFNLRADALAQSGAAIATIQQFSTTVPAQYIDVRVPGRVYYK